MLLPDPFLFCGQECGHDISIRATIRGMAARSNAASAAVAVIVPLAPFAIASTFGSIQNHTYVHVMAGVLSTGIDLFMALVVGPV